MSVGTLYVVATPIGNLGDITTRSLEILQKVDCIAAEDTRHSKKLLAHFAINTPLLSLHEHNEKSRIPQIIERLQGGESFAIISDAGTPLISDPGFHLVRLVRDQNIPVSPIPGACAAIAALSAAGLASDKFVFEGFLPATTSRRRKALEILTDETHTLLFYEAPHRIIGLLTDIVQVFGAERRVVVAREVTKKFEQFITDTAQGVLDYCQQHPEKQRGEFVVMIEGRPPSERVIDKSVMDMLTYLAEELPLKQAAKLTAKITGVKKNSLYQWGVDHIKQ